MFTSLDHHFLITFITSKSPQQQQHLTQQSAPSTATSHSDRQTRPVRDQGQLKTGALHLLHGPISSRACAPSILRLRVLLHHNEINDGATFITPNIPRTLDIHHFTTSGVNDPRDISPPTTIRYMTRIIKSARAFGQDITPPTPRDSPRSKTGNESPAHTAATMSTPVDTAQQPVIYPRTSFMGLPPEMRLRIYGYLVNGGRVMHAGSRNTQCTAMGRGDRQDEPRLKCRCVESVWPQVLAINSPVLAEAMPVLYRTTEFHVRLPDFDHRDPKPDLHKIPLSKLPEYGLPHVRCLTLPGYLDDVATQVWANDPEMEYMSIYWSWLANMDLNLRHIRLSIFADAMPAMTSTHVNIASFAGILSIPRVRTIILQVPCDIFQCVYAVDDEDDDASWIEDVARIEDDSIVKTNRLRDGILAVLQREAKQMSNPPNIVDISLDWLESISVEERTRTSFPGTGARQLRSCTLARELRGP